MKMKWKFFLVIFIMVNFIKVDFDSFYKRGHKAIPAIRDDFHFPNFQHSFTFDINCNCNSKSMCHCQLLIKRHMLVEYNGTLRRTQETTLGCVSHSNLQAHSFILTLHSMHSGRKYMHSALSHFTGPFSMHIELC